jgi:hypothetical protein
MHMFRPLRPSTGLALVASMFVSVTLATPTAAPPAPIPPTAKPSLTLSSGLNSTQSGAFTVHYNAMPSTQLTPEIATRYGITRSSNRALLNVSVMKGPRAAEAVAVAARVEAVAINGTGQRQTLNLREVRDRGAIYYLGEARIDERDELVFELVVTPEGGAAINARYRQEFWPPAAAR